MKIVIGTMPECDIKISDPYASPRHCEVFQVNEMWAVRDLGSTNGTHVLRAGVSLKAGFGGVLPLKIGDVIIVGRTELPAWDRP